MTREEAIKVLMNTEDNINYDKNRDEIYFTHEWVGAYEMAIAALREQESLAKKQATSDWISVKDQRPEYKTRVLFVDESKRVWLAKDSVDWPDGGVSFLEPESGLWVRGTHWMPLPEPPKEEV